MSKQMRLSALIAVSTVLALGACDGSGEHQNADEVQPDSQQAPVTGPAAGAQGTRIQTAPPPAGAVNPLPPDSNPSASTPATPSTSGGATGTPGAAADTTTPAARP